MFPKLSKIRHKLIAMVILLLLSVLLAVTGITHYKALNVIHSQSRYFSNNTLELSINDLDNSIEQLDSIFQSLYLKEEFRNYLKQQSRNTNFSSSIEYTTLMKSTLLSLVNGRSNLYSVIYIDFTGNLTYSTRDAAGHYSDYRQADLPADYLELVNHVQSWDKGIRILPTHHHMELKGCNDPFVYTVARKILNTEAHYETMGVMFITIDLSELEKLSRLISPYEGTITYIIDEKGNYIFDSQGQKTGTIMPEILKNKLFSSDTVNLSDKKYVVFFSNASQNGWHIINLVPEIISEANATSVSNCILIATGVALLFAIVLTAFFSRRISRPIENLANTMSRTELHHMDSRVELEGNDEIALLGREFNTLLDNLEDSISREYVLTLSQKDAQIRELQAQMNPHFLYNVLQSISSIALIKNVPEVHAIANAMGVVLRYSIKPKSNTATVSEELEHVKNYLAIQQIRYGNRLNYEIDVPEYIMECILPRVSLQPMVENSIIHGFEDRQEAGNILISGSQQEDNIIIDVSDDGNGIPFDKLDRIKAELADRRDLGDNNACGIGLINLSTRLRLLYGEKAYLVIESEPQIGTSIQIIVPYERK